MDASTLTAANFNGFDPDGAASSYLADSGTSGDDILTGSYDADVIDGGAGNDRIEETFGGSDTLSGGDGNDFILLLPVTPHLLLMSQSTAMPVTTLSISPWANRPVTLTQR